jgi:hypothetical protein
MANLDSALLAFASALVIAALTAVFAYLRYVREQEHQRTTLLNALFAELASIFEHYTYAAFELPIDPSGAFELKKRLRWSKYGGLRSTNDVGKLGFLDASNIRALLQLELRIRNDNALLDQLLEGIPDLTSRILQDTKNRLRQRIADAGWLLKQLVDKRPELERVLADLKKELPNIGANI